MEIYKSEYIRNEASFANKKAYVIFLKGPLADYYVLILILMFHPLTSTPLESMESFTMFTFG